VIAALDIWSHTNADELILTAAAVLAALGVIHRTLIRPVIRFGHRVESALNEVEKQLKPNGGSTTRDSLNRVEAMVHNLSADVATVAPLRETVMVQERTLQDVAVRVAILEQHMKETQ